VQGRRTFGAALCFALGTACALTPVAAQAGEFYVSGGLAMSWATADASGDNTIGATSFPNTGSPSDSSPSVALALGFEFPVHQLLPRRMPRWMPDLDLQDWGIRSEIEASGARAYDLRASNDTDPHHADLTHWSLLWNVYLDLPLGNALQAVFRRTRRLEPLVFSPTFGVGYARAKIVSDNVFAVGRSVHNELAWQAGFELGYPLSDNVTLTGGYRYFSIGNLETALRDDSGALDLGDLGLDVGGHELRATLRWRFYSVRFPRGLFQSSRRRYDP
jgi:opacity protein-like surface antigen